MATFRPQKQSRVKEENKRKISTYLNDPDNEWLHRAGLGVTVCGYKDQRSLYKHFSPEELTELENEALEERKRRSSGKRAVVYHLVDSVVCFINQDQCRRPILC